MVANCVIVLGVVLVCCELSYQRGNHVFMKKSCTDDQFCANGSTCVKLPVGGGVVCKCPVNATGWYCNISYITPTYDPSKHTLHEWFTCEMEICEGGSTCYQLEGGVICLCPANRTGSVCEETLNSSSTTKVTTSSAAGSTATDTGIHLLIIN